MQSTGGLKLLETNVTKCFLTGYFRKKWKFRNLTLDTSQKKLDQSILIAYTECLYYAK